MAKKKAGRPKKVRTTVTLAIRIEESLADKIKLIAKYECRSQNNVISMMLDKAVKSRL